MSTRLDHIDVAEVVRSVDELLALTAGMDPEELYVIGGSSVYRQLLPYCSRAFVTRFDGSYEADAFIPDLAADPDWYLTHRGPDMMTDPETDSATGVRYWFEEYRRRC